ncbi:hypothetical protein ACFOUP_04790 [Belliella kenyensis]|uniref:Addiction module component n=1 Tax=Belliella kenyensis TaxID=1472724 RepID=A0ABV8EJI0_9BACT|nr:hypothetical protein [Belliella kenyensis]MCH7403483.1 hypothetical protein [Belliella kenyensis]MDN3602383.1 hypothetical protein [Belliella kenyensis]
MFKLQYISDSSGKTTGVFIPIYEWVDLKKRLQDIDLESTPPHWQQKDVTQRLDLFKKSPDTALDFEKAISDIEKEL